jgi:hypothetical protein
MLAHTAAQVMQEHIDPYNVKASFYRLLNHAETPKKEPKEGEEFTAEQQEKANQLGVFWVERALTELRDEVHRMMRCGRTPLDSHGRVPSNDPLQCDQLTRCTA